MTPHPIDILKTRHASSRHHIFIRRGKKVNLEHLVKDICAIVELSATKKGITLTCNMDPQIPDKIKADPKRVRQVLINILGNAVKFTEEGGVAISVKAIRKSGQHTNLSFSISDTGIGIAKSKQVEIFENFVQTDHLITRKYGGSGLGLSISKTLVELMGGEIKVTPKRAALSLST